MGLQVALEKQFVDLVSIKPKGKYAFVLCDRGLLDGSAYIPDEDFDGMLAECGLDRNDCMNTYDIIIHMVTAAKGAEEFFTVDNNDARSENLELAKELDQKTQKAWSNHPNFFYNHNNVENFAEKVNNASNYILKKLGMPVGSQFHCKFTVRNPKGKFFKYLVKVFNCNQTSLEDIIFTNTGAKATKVEGEDVKDTDQPKKSSTIYYIRKRVSPLPR
jgi:cell division septum initiation protein DivIVA